MVVYVMYFFVIYEAFVNSLKLEKDHGVFFNEVVFPLAYLMMIWKKLPRKEKEVLGLLRASLEVRLRDSIYSEELKKEWMKQGMEYAKMYQRSSSCVEGRNGMLSLYHHRFHRLNPRGLKALTVVHNYHIQQPDKTTAAERLFGCKHNNLFESLIANVRIPGRPQQQNHDVQRRQKGWEKRRMA